MASQKPQDPLDVLQLMVNDVLVHTGKALRASRKDSQGNIAQSHAPNKSKLSDSVFTFSNALDDLESEIIKAKSVLYRDLNQLRERKQQQQQQQLQQQQQEQQKQEAQQQLKQPQKHQQPPQVSQQPQPIEPQSKEPIVIDLDSSPPPNAQPMTDTKPPKPVAPFPDMGMGMSMPDLGHNDVIVKTEPPTMTPTPTPGINTQFKSGPMAATAPMAPMPDMDEKPVDIDIDMTGGDMSNQELNFTNMEFTLAPNEGHNPPTTQDPSFDLTAFAPNDGGDDFLSLENLLPNDQPNAGGAVQPPVKTETPNTNNPPPNADTMLTQDFGKLKKEETGDSTFEDILMETGGDFGGGLGEDTFNDLMIDRDEPFDLMEHGAFDASYFGLDNAE